MSKEIKGVIAAVATPFDDQERIDREGFKKLLDHAIAGGVNGLFPVGSQGEFWALERKEKEELMDLAVEHVAGRVFVMPNAGAVTTRESVELARYAERAGADAVSVITPFFISPTQDELYRHFADICQAVSIPVLAYNNPDRTGGLKLTTPTLAKLATDCPNFHGIKDSSGDISELAQMIRLCPPGFRVFVGRDTAIYAALTYGAAGAVAATASAVPRLVADIYQSFIKGDHAAALAAQRRLAPFRMAFGLGSFPAVVKEAQRLMGLPGGNCRRPIGPLSAEKRAELRKILVAIGVLAA